MKKTILFALLALSLYSCRKREDEVSSVVSPSYPTITFSGARYYSIHPGDALPTVSATAYDSALRASYDVKLSADAVDAKTPGLYIVPVKATNKYGYSSSAPVYIAVTDISDEANLEGVYLRAATGIEMNVTKVARGLYRTDNVGGSTLAVEAFFVQLGDTTLSLPVQPTSQGDLSATEITLSQVPGGDTTIAYKVVNGSFGTAKRIFVKQ